MQAVGDEAKEYVLAAVAAQDERHDGRLWELSKLICWSFWRWGVTPSGVEYTPDGLVILIRGRTPYVITPEVGERWFDAISSADSNPLLHLSVALKETWPAELPKPF